MSLSLDHLIVPVNDLDATVTFWTRFLGVSVDGRDGPFTVIRVDPTTVILLSPYGTEGNHHYAFALDPEGFAAAFERLKQAGIPYGGGFDTVGQQTDPGLELGALGMGPSVYFFDPNHHLLEIRTTG